MYICAHAHTNIPKYYMHTRIIIQYIHKYTTTCTNINVYIWTHVYIFCAVRIFTWHTHSPA